MTTMLDALQRDFSYFSTSLYPPSEGVSGGVVENASTLAEVDIGRLAATSWVEKFDAVYGTALTAEEKIKYAESVVIIRSRALALAGKKIIDEEIDISAKKFGKSMTTASLSTKARKARREIEKSIASGGGVGSGGGPTVSLSAKDIVQVVFTPYNSVDLKRLGKSVGIISGVHSQPLINRPQLLRAIVIEIASRISQ